MPLALWVSTPKKLQWLVYRILCIIQQKWWQCAPTAQRVKNKTKQHGIINDHSLILSSCPSNVGQTNKPGSPCACFQHVTSPSIFFFFFWFCIWTLNTEVKKCFRKTWNISIYAASFFLKAAAFLWLNCGLFFFWFHWHIRMSLKVVRKVLLHRA